MDAGFGVTNEFNLLVTLKPQQGAKRRSSSCIWNGLPYFFQKLLMTYFLLSISILDGHCEL